ncbi:MAG: response regulator [Hyphomonadaceae bacterium]
MKTTILVVDDLEENRALLARRLERLGFEVREAISGADAVVCAIGERPDLIIMDISMPEIDGIEAWRILQEMCPNPPPVIALTAVCVRDLEHTCLELGFSAYLQKPCDIAVLKREIDACLVQSKAA